MNNKNFKVGDKVINFGSAYRIFKIKGKKDKILFFKPFFKNNSNRGLVYSIPEANLRQTNIRRPFSQRKLLDLLKKVSKRRKVKMARNTAKLKEVLNQNEPVKTLGVLKQLADEQKKNPDGFTISKHNLFKLALKKIQEEAALSFGTSLSKAEERIKKFL